MNIHSAMVAIAKEIASEGIGKTRKNQQQHYNFRGVDEVMNAFAPILSKHSVFVRPSFSNRQMLERETKNGGALFYVTLEGSFTFTHEDASEVTVGPFFGEAMDSGDKATNKAMAVAFKYAMFQTFCVPLEGVTGGDADQTTHEVKPAGKPTDGAWEQAEALGWTREAIEQIGATANEYWETGDVQGAAEYLESKELPHEAKIAVWTLFDSKFRAAIKKHNETKSA